MSDHLNATAVREDGRYQGGALVHEKGVPDQPLPGGKATAREDTVKLTDG